MYTCTKRRKNDVGTLYELFSIVQITLYIYIAIDTHIIIALWPLPAIHWTLRIYKLLLTCLSNSSHWAALTLSAAWMVWICVETAESTASSRRLNSSKHPQAPHLTRPMNILPIDFTSMPSSQLNTSTCVSDLYEKIHDQKVVSIEFNCYEFCSLSIYMYNVYSTSHCL